MSRTVAILAVLIVAPLLFAGVAHAADAAARPPAATLSGVAATFGNTIISTYPDGRTQKVWLQPDGVWTGLNRRGVPLVGRWTLKGDKVCLKQSKPPTLPLSFCQALPSDMSREMDSHDLLGTPIRLHVVRGLGANPG
jgi:hypothetical protein